MHHDDTETQTHHTTPNPEAPHVGQIGESLVGLEKLGRLWATHGIRMGVAALQTSAVTLTQVASTLATLAEGLKAHEEKAADEERPQG